MLKNINTLLESFGLGLQKRAVHVQFSNQALNGSVFLQCIQGQQHINQGLKAELLCLSTDADIALAQANKITKAKFDVSLVEKFM